MIRVMWAFAALAVILAIGMIATESSQQPQTTSSSATSTVSATSKKNPKQAINDRVEYTHELEEQMLSLGLDAHVRAIGKQQDTLRISWAAMSRPVVFKMINEEGMSSQVPELGFRKVIFTDDGSFSGLSPIESWTYTWNGSDWEQPHK